MLPRIVLVGLIPGLGLLKIAVSLVVQLVQAAGQRDPFRIGHKAVRVKRPAALSVHDAVFADRRHVGRIPGVPRHVGKGRGGLRPFEGILSRGSADRQQQKAEYARQQQAEGSVFHILLRIDLMEFGSSFIDYTMTRHGASRAERLLRGCHRLSRRGFFHRPETRYVVPIRKGTRPARALPYQKPRMPMPS